jgi:UDP-N-acetylmuramoyl-L-alanyl-D-glutamate--2,6-diaminopimelate ligase
MKLSDLLGEVKDVRCTGDAEIEITSICTDSRTAQPGCLFAAVPGYRDNGLKYVGDALSRGAAALLVEEGSGIGSAGLAAAPGAIDRPSAPGGADSEKQGAGRPVPVCCTRSVRRSVLELARAFFGYPSSSFHLTGVTGTNGKTTVTYLIEAFLEQAGHVPGVVGTINYRYAGTAVKAGNTTPDPLALQAMFSGMKDKVSHLVMEVSSHALAMDRVFPGDFDAALFTNLSQDHLDFHADMEDYFQAKARLFTGLKQSSIAVINVDDVYGKRLAGMSAGTVTTCALGAEADYRCTGYDLSITGSRFTVNGREYVTHLVGTHNVGNILAALALALRIGIPEETIGAALERFENVPGRFERVGAGGDFHVFVDYAHTPDALAHIIETANQLKQARVITVFGCGGDRDRTKRPKMGAVVEQGSDVSIVTSDNPRTEDPLAIIEEIKAGMKGHNALVIPDRREAIHQAVSMARRNDIVLIAGKGHEDYQILGEKRIHFDDREVALEALSE